MPTPATEREQALRWLIAHRRLDVSLEQTVRLLCTVLPRDLDTLQVLRRIAEEEEAKQAPPTVRGYPAPGRPPRRPRNRTRDCR